MTAAAKSPPPTAPSPVPRATLTSAHHPTPSPSPTTATTTSTAASSRPARVYYFDYLRVLATVGVVLLHSSSPLFLAMYGNNRALMSDSTFVTATDAAGRFGVDTFFMISGALLLAPYRQFRLRKQAVRVGVPLVVWSAVYLGVLAYLDHRNLPEFASSNGNPRDFFSAVKAFFVGPVAYHLWFVYVLLGIYVVVPLLRPLTALAAERRDQLLRYALTVWLVCTVGLQAFYAFHSSAQHVYQPAMPAVPVQFLGVALLGFYLHHHTPTWRGRALRRSELVGCALAGFLAVVLLTVYSDALGVHYTWTLDDLSPQVVLFAGSVFLLAKATLDRPGRAFGWISTGSRLSYRVYLVHPLVLLYLTRLSPWSDFYGDNPQVSIPAVAVTTLLISFAFSWLVDRMGRIRDYV